MSSEKMLMKTEANISWCSLVCLHSETPINQTLGVAEESIFPKMSLAFWK